MASFGDLTRFYRLVKNRLKSNADYFKLESFQSDFVIKDLNDNGIFFGGKNVLDVGSGRGGYSSKLFEQGANVIALDITRQYYQNVRGVKFILGDATKMPFKPGSFDFIFCSSLIEHIKNQDLFILELKRVLKKGGMCYLSFPPFWSPVGAHQFKPFHYFGEKNAIKLSRKFYNVRSFRYDDFYGKLYKTKIKDIKNLIKKSGLSIKRMTTRLSPINFAKIPVLNELLTWHVEFLLKKN